MAKKFLRQDYMRHIKLGKHRKKLQKWRSPKGMHSKMRNKRKGYPASPSVGYKSPKKEKGKILGLNPKIINNMKDLQNTAKNNIIIISQKIGARKRIEIIKKASESGIKILNAHGGFQNGLK